MDYVCQLLPLFSFLKFNNVFSSNFWLIYCFELMFHYVKGFFKLFLSRFVHFVGSMQTFMTDDTMLSYILMFSFLVRVFVVFL